MAFIPLDAEWYLADIVLEYSIDGDSRNVVHINTHLIKASSPDEAYEKSEQLGRGSEHSYENTDGKKVTVKFRGLQDLNVIHDPLEDGAELVYQQKTDISDENISLMISSKAGLSVFLPIEPQEGPNYLAKSVMFDVKKLMEGEE